MAVILDSLLIGGIRFVLDKIASAVEAEMNDEGGLREQLLAAQMQLELGEIDDGEFAAIESEVMARLREIREARGEGAVGVPRDARVVGDKGEDELARQLVHDKYAQPCGDDLTNWRRESLPVAVDLREQTTEGGAP